MDACEPGNGPVGGRPAPRENGHVEQTPVCPRLGGNGFTWLVWQPLRERRARGFQHSIADPETYRCGEKGKRGKTEGSAGHARLHQGKAHVDLRVLGTRPWTCHSPSPRR